MTVLGNEGSASQPDPDSPSPAFGTPRRVNVIRGRTGLLRWSVVLSAAFAPHGNLLATGGLDRKIRLWDIDTGRCVRTLHGHRSAVDELVFAPPGDLLASCGGDHRVRLWDVATGRCVQVLPGRTDIGRGIAFSPDGRLLTTVAEDSMVQLWDPVGGRHLRTLPTRHSALCAPVFSPDGRLLATATRHRAHLRDLTTGEPVHTLDGHRKYVHAMAFSPDGRLFATGDGTFYFNPADHDGYIRPEEREIESGSGRVRLWDVTNGELLCEPMNRFSAPVSALAFTPDGRHLAAAGSSLWVRDMTTGTNHAGAPHPCSIGDLALSPDGRLMATVGSDRKVRLWSQLSGQAPPG